MSVIAALAAALIIVRYVFFAAAVVAAGIFLLDWLVRTRRISPFSPIARFSRSVVDPLIAPVERSVVRAGGLPTSAPWWALVAVVVGGLVILYLLEFLITQVALLGAAASSGPSGILRILLYWTFAILRIALLVRVVSSWLRMSPYSRWVRWAFNLTEPILRPLRGVVPPLGMIDVTPLVAYFVLYLLERVVFSMIS